MKRRNHPARRGDLVPEETAALPSSLPECIRSQHSRVRPRSAPPARGLGLVGPRNWGPGGPRHGLGALFEDGQAFPDSDGGALTEPGPLPARASPAGSCSHGTPVAEGTRRERSAARHTALFQFRETGIRPFWVGTERFGPTSATAVPGCRVVP